MWRALTTPSGPTTKAAEIGGIHDLFPRNGAISKPPANTSEGFWTYPDKVRRRGARRRIKARCYRFRSNSAFQIRHRILHSRRERTNQMRKNSNGDSHARHCPRIPHGFWSPRKMMAACGPSIRIWLDRQAPRHPGPRNAVQHGTAGHRLDHFKRYGSKNEHRLGAAFQSTMSWCYEMHRQQL